MSDFIESELMKLDRAQKAHRDNAQMKEFDWDKAQKLVSEYDIKDAWAGLAEDWDWTAGKILENGEWIADHGAYLSSTWATPVLLCNEMKVDCWKWQTEKTKGENYD